MSAHAIGHVHEPVQTLANTAISFSRPPQGEKRSLRLPGRRREGGACKNDGLRVS